MVSVVLVAWLEAGPTDVKDVGSKGIFLKSAIETSNAYCSKERRGGIVGTLPEVEFSKALTETEK